MNFRSENYITNSFEIHRHTVSIFPF